MGAKREKFAAYVAHPRYGRSPRVSSEDVPLKEVQQYWRTYVQKYYPESAIRADTSKQHFTVFPRPVYVDLDERCRTCGRPFIFFAQEQKHWYEELGFYIDAHCVDCWECRQQQHDVRWMERRVTTLRGDAESLRDKEWMELAWLYLKLLQLGRRKSLQRMRWALNRVRDVERFGGEIERLRRRARELEEPGAGRSSP